VIVRLMGEGQFKVPDEALDGLNAIDNAAVEALDRGDEDGFRAKLDELVQAVRQRGERLPDDTLEGSDLLVPPTDLTLDEARQLFSGEGLIPDLPS
jgi:hypothetical protein